MTAIERVKQDLIDLGLPVLEVSGARGSYQFDFQPGTTDKQKAQAEAVAKLIDWHDLEAIPLAQQLADLFQVPPDYRDEFLYRIVDSMVGAYQSVTEGFPF